MLKLLRTLRHPNIVPVMCSYTYNNDHNFLFPSYKLDLKQFLQTDVRLADFQWNFTFHLALCGLASALENTHGIRLNAKEHGLDMDAIGYHNDFRPANVLVSTNTFIWPTLASQSSNLRTLAQTVSGSPAKVIISPLNAWTRHFHLKKLAVRLMSGLSDAS